MPALSHELAITTNYIAKHVKKRPRVAIVLGSGLGEIAQQIGDATVLEYRELPNFPPTSVLGHKGRLVAGMLGGVQAIVFDGRLHFYEGLTMRQVAYPVYVARALGAQTLIATNAAGGINPSFEAGDIMLIADHINLTGASPLTGPHEPKLGMRFVDMRGAYDADLRAAACGAADGATLREGVYAALSGPAYETDAEVRMLRLLGADAVGMSTVPEVIAARHSGMRVAALSVIANAVRAQDAQSLRHEDVLQAVLDATPRVARIIEAVVRRCAP